MSITSGFQTVPPSVCSGSCGSYQVLLKRYLKSLPFIELLGFLSQFFRRLLSLRGPIRDSLEYIQRLAERSAFWDQEELEAVSRLDMAAAFQGNVIPFDSRWKQYLEEPLPKELKLLQVCVCARLCLSVCLSVYMCGQSL